jgi:hypothetical protein
MSSKSRVLLVLVGWVAVISVLHLWLNLGAFDARRPAAHDSLPFRVGFLPVT